MPYISKEERKRFNSPLNVLEYEFSTNGVTPGELNYLLTQICIMYYDTKGPGYTFLNDTIGALESCKQEFYRREVTPYEDEKIEQNSDVY